MTFSMTGQEKGDFFYIEGKYEIKMCVYFVYVLCPVGFDYLLFTVL
jgi:hypothetical protein